MGNRYIAIGIAFLAAVAVFGIGGYYMGTRTSTKTVQESAYSGSAGGAAAVGQGFNNHSSLISDLKARLKANPDDADILLRLADTYFDLKQFDEAATYYMKVSELKPENADIFNDIGLSLHYKGNSPEGLRYIDKGIKKNPYHQRIWLTKGFILAYGMGDLEGARQAWEKTKALNPDSRVGKAASDYLAQIAKK